jgi:glycosyltransferase involved in cell wall biosynthesis
MGTMGLQLYYELWQRRIGQVALQLDRKVDFDVIHHITLSSYWNRVGVSSVEKPLVLGPVGGGVVAPLGLLPVLGLKGLGPEVARRVARPLLARATGSRAVSGVAKVVLVMNPETKDVIAPWARASLASHVTAAEPTVPKETQRGTDVVTVGRLIPWKGTALALRAMAHVRSDSRLVIVGEGRSRRHLVRLAESLGISERVIFLGQLGRDKVFELVHRAGVFLHCALHEEGSLAVAEALALGTPVVALDRGGPPVSASCWPFTPSRLIRPTTTRRTALDLGLAVDDLLSLKTPTSSQLATRVRNFEGDLVDAYTRALTGKVA